MKKLIILLLIGVGINGLKAQQLYKMAPADSTLKNHLKMAPQMPSIQGMPKMNFMPVLPKTNLSNSIAQLNLPKLNSTAFFSQMPVLVTSGTDKMPIAKLNGVDRMPIAGVNKMPGSAVTELNKDKPAF